MDKHGNNIWRRKENVEDELIRHIDQAKARERAGSGFDTSILARIIHYQPAVARQLAEMFGQG